MGLRHRSTTRFLVRAALALLTATGTAAHAQGPATAADPDAGRPDTELVLDQAAYYQLVQRWVQSVEAASLDAALPQILGAGRAAARRQDWAAAEAAVENLKTAHAPAGLVPLLRGVLAGGRGDAEDHRTWLMRAAPELVAGGATTMAVDTWRYLAVHLTETGDLEGALECLTQARAYAADSASVHFLLGRLSWVRRDFGAAIAAWERAADLAPENPIVWFALAEAYGATGASDRATWAAERTIELAPDWIYPRVQLGEWLLRAGRAQAAFNVLLPMVARMPDAPRVRSLMAEAARQLGESHEFSRQAAQLQARRAPANDWAALGRLETRAGNLENASTAYRMALALDPTYGEYGFLLGGVQAQMWDFAGAIAAYQQALAAGFPPVACHFNLGLMYTAAERYDEAIAAFDASQAEGGVSEYVQGGKGVALFRAGRLTEAEAVLSDAVAANPDSAVNWESYGRVMLALALPQAAREAFRMARDQQTTPNRWTRYWLGRAELALDRPEGALEAFRGEYELAGSSPELAYWAAVAAQQANRTGLAYLAFNIAIQHAPGVADAWRGVAELDQARGRLDAAERGYARAEALGSDSGLLLFRRGELAWARGHTAEARAKLEAAVDRDPALTAAWQRLGAIQAEMGDLGAARQSFARAYGQQRTAWFLQRSLERFFVGALWIACFLAALIIGSRLRRRAAYAWLPLFVARLDLAVVTVLALLVPVVLTVAGQRLLYASFELQRLTNRQAFGFNSFLAFRDGVFLGLLPVAYLWWRHGRPNFTRLPVRRLATHVGLGLAGCLLFALPGLIAQILAQDVMGAGVLPRERNFFNATPRNVAASVVGIGLVSSVAQEVFYRGVLFRLSREQVGAVAAAILSALLFAAFHFQPVNFWWYGLFGLLAAFLYHRTGSLVAPIVMHVLFNVVQVIV